MATKYFNDNWKDQSGYVSKPRCHTTHKPIKLGNGEILGAACGSPREGYDIYIGFDYGMKFKHQLFPWDKTADPIVEFQYHITDMCAPKSPKEFKKMLNWCAEQLEDGKKIHIGCIGGHGRTGTFLAALISLYPDLTDDPIQWVRDNHCKKAVESASQIKFLAKHFGCKTAEPTKGFSNLGTPKTRDYSKGTDDWAPYRTGKPLQRQKHLKTTISCVSKKGSIWG